MEKMNITLEVELSPIEEKIVSVLSNSQWKYSVKTLNFNLKEEGYIVNPWQLSNILERMCLLQIIRRIEVGSPSNKHYLYFI